MGRGLETGHTQTVGKRSLLCARGIEFSQQCCEEEIAILTLQRRKARLRELQQLVQGPGADGNLI